MKTFCVYFDGIWEAGVEAGTGAVGAGTELSTAAGAAAGATVETGAGVEPGMLSPAPGGAVTGSVVRSSKLPESVGRRLPK